MLCRHCLDHLCLHRVRVRCAQYGPPIYHHCLSPRNSQLDAVKPPPFCAAVCCSHQGSCCRSRPQGLQTTLPHGAPRFLFLEDRLHCLLGFPRLPTPSIWQHFGWRFAPLPLPPLPHSASLLCRNDVWHLFSTPEIGVSLQARQNCSPTALLLPFSSTQPRT